MSLKWHHMNGNTNHQEPECHCYYKVRTQEWLRWYFHYNLQHITMCSDVIASYILLLTEQLIWFDPVNPDQLFLEYYTLWRNILIQSSVSLITAVAHWHRFTDLSRNDRISILCHRLPPIVEYNHPDRGVTAKALR